jgi:tetratricopeptide (TPR) repeat protein
MRTRTTTLLGVLLALAAWPSHGQVPDPKNNFVQALARFSLALDGSYGDEGSRVVSNLQAVERGLEQWDTAIRSYEAAMAAEIGRAEPRLTSRMHAGLGGVYLDRIRPQDALREFAVSVQLDPSRADVYALQGLAYTRPPAHDAAAATAAFRKASELDPISPVRAYVLARHLIQVGKPEEADKAFQMFQANWKQHVAERGEAPLDSPFTRSDLVQERAGVEPFLPPALYVEGFTLLRRGDFEHAIAQFKEATAHDVLVADPVEKIDGMKMAVTAFRDGSVESAVERLKTVIQSSPESSEPHRILGRAYLADQRNDVAVEEFKTAVRLKLNDERTRLGLADALVETRRLAEAESALRDTMAAFPASGRAHYALGRLYQRQGQLTDALAEFKAAVALEPLLGLNTLYQAIGGISASRQDFAAAIDAYSKRLDILPNDAGAHQDLGDMYLRLGRHAEALAEFSVVLLLNPKRADGYAAMAQIYLQDRRYADSAAMARRAIERDPANRQARYTLATSLVRLGKTDEGSQELEVYQRLQGEATAALSRQFQLDGLRREASETTANGNHERAVELLRKALELEPNSVSSHLDLGVALLEAGHPAEAVDQFKSAEALHAHFGVHRYLAEAYARSGKPEESQREQELYDQMRQDSLRRAGANR